MKALLPHQSFSYLLILLTGIFMFISCSDELPLIEPDVDHHHLLREDPQGIAKHRFGQILLSAMINEEPVKEFLKEEAMKMFNYDYDVFYPLVKDKPMANGKTLKETLLQYSDNPGELYEIEAAIPLLTIFVPELPENSFSAHSWNTATEIPHVAVRLTATGDVPMISPEGEEYLLNADLTPGYPAVVIKDNERMIYKGHKDYNKYNSTREFTNSEGMSYKLLSDVFDKELEDVTDKAHLRAVNSWSIDYKIMESYDIYASHDGWQRDYIYYNITPSNPNGALNYDFQEHIRYFHIVGNAWDVWKKMYDEGQDTDPFIKSGKKSYGWTEGLFEIRATTYLHPKNASMSQSIANEYLVSGAGLFSVTYKKERKGMWPFKYDYYTVQSVTAKPQYTNYPIDVWNLQNYASTFRIDIEESDSPTTITNTTSRAVEFATNFGIEGTILKKLGLKFGVSAKTTTTRSEAIQRTLGSYQMGSVMVNFQDNILISKDNYPTYGIYNANTREYTNNTFSISVEPKRVQ